MNSVNMKLTEKQQKYQYNHLEKFSSKKSLEKQTKKQVDVLKSLNLSNKTGELKQIESIFSKNILSDLIINK